MYDHVSMIIYCTFSAGGVVFTIPTNPGPYSPIVNNDTVICENLVTEHKTEVLGMLKKHCVSRSKQQLTQKS